MTFGPSYNIIINYRLSNCISCFPHRPKGSQLSADTGAAGCPPQLPRPAQECHQHSPVRPGHELQGQPGDSAAALQNPPSGRSRKASRASCSAHTQQASPALCSRRSAPHAPHAQAPFTASVCTTWDSRGGGRSCNPDGHDHAAGSAPSGPAGSETGTWRGWRGSRECQPSSRSTRRASFSSRGQTAPRAQPRLPR